MTQRIAVADNRWIVAPKPLRHPGMPFGIDRPQLNRFQTGTGVSCGIVLVW